MSDESHVLQYSQKVVPPRWAKFLMRPLGWITFLTLGIGMAVVLWESRLPGSLFAISILFWLFAIIMAIWIGVRWALLVILWKVYEGNWKGFTRGGWRVVLAVSMVVATGLLASSGFVTNLGFKVSESTMRRMAEDIIRAESAKAGTVKTKYPSRRAGVYQLEDVTFLPESKSVRFYIVGAGFFSREGFAFSPSGKPVERSDFPNEGTGYYTHLHGDWYSVREGF